MRFLKSRKLVPTKDREQDALRIPREARLAVASQFPDHNEAADLRPPDLERVDAKSQRRADRSVISFLQGAK